MNVLMLNGSPRMKGNTRTALGVLEEGLRRAMPDAEVEIADISRLKILPCLHCNACRKGSGDCVQQDDTKILMDKLYAAEVLVFGSPVYWWGISGQLKTVMDKMYSKSLATKKVHKKAAVLIVGEAGLDESQYRLIREQFECICDYLEWDLRFYEAFCTPGIDSLINSVERLQYIEKLALKLV